MLGRSKEDDTEQTAGWTQRVDKLLAGNVSQQVGSAVEALARDFADLARRVEAMSEQLSSVAATPSQPDLSPAIAALEARLDALAKPDDIVRAVRESSPDLSGIEASLRAAVAELASKIDAFTDKPAPPAGLSDEDIARIVSPRFESIDQRVDNLGRNVGGALGRLRVQSDEIVEKANALIALRDELAKAPSSMRQELRERIDAMQKAVEGRIAAISSADQMSAMQNAIEVKIAALPFGDQIKALQHALEDKLAALPFAEIGRREQENEKRMEAQSQQIAAVAARVKAATEAFGTQLQQVAQRTDAIAGLGDDIAGMRVMLESSAKSSSGAVSAVDAGLTQITQSLATLEARISAMPSDESLLALRDEVIRETAGAVERVSRDLSDRLGAAVDAIQSAQTVDAMAGLLGEERVASERRNEALVHQVAAVMGSVISSMGEMRSQLEAIEGRPDVPPALREEIGRMLGEAMLPATERLAALEQRLQQAPDPAQSVRPMIDEVRADIQRIAESAGTQSEALAERVSADADVRMRGIAEEVSKQAAALAKQAGTTSLSAAEGVVERLKALDEHLSALPDGARVAGLMESIHELEEEMRKERTEQFSTLSASVGAIYLRVRSLEQAISELKVLSEHQGGDSRSQITTVLERFQEVASLEARLADEITGIQDTLRRGAVERERDREILTVLAQLADSAGKAERGGLAERLRSLIARGSKYEERIAEETVTVDLSD